MTITVRIFLCIGLALGVCWFLLLHDNPRLSDAEKAALYPAHRDMCERAIAGDPDAQEQLGLLFLRGEVVNQDFVQARTWLRQSARAMRPESIYQMGVLYNEGKGGAQDHNLAINYLKIAAKAGDQRAVDALESNPLWKALTTPISFQ